ncbi:MAG: hypothetical protein AAGF12_31140, partial [Myxococcota bacterium]
PRPAAPIPDYALSLSGGAQEIRAEPSSGTRFYPETTLEVVVRPDQGTDRPVHIEAVFEDPAGRVRRIEGTFDEAPGGAFRLRGPAGELFPEAFGRIAATVVVSSDPSLGSRSPESLQSTIDDESTEALRFELLLVRESP